MTGGRFTGVFLYLAMGQRGSDAEAPFLGRCAIASFLAGIGRNGRDLLMLVYDLRWAGSYVPATVCFLFTLVITFSLLDDALGRADD